MKNENGKPDFSRGRYRAMLIWQRERMWSDEAVERLAAWMELRPGMKALDVGCGLGYLGYTFWKHFGQNGSYTGVDIRPGLIEEAAETAREWAKGGEAFLIEGDVYDLPLDNDSFDWVVCQTLMIHLARPEDALREMIRVLRPGGLIVCIEPDNLRPTLTQSASSLPPFDLDLQLLQYKVNVIASRGRIRQGHGDKGIGPLLPHMLAQAGIKRIDIRTRETVSYFLPPYETEQQKAGLANMKKYWIDDANYRARTDETRRDFLAGGGDPDDFDRLQEAGEKWRQIQIQQMDEGSFYICGAYPVYIIKGRKPAR